MTKEVIVLNFEYLHPADQLVMVMNRIYEHGLTTTSGGNLSIRDGNGDIWITPAGIDKGTLTRRDIICVKPDGTYVGRHTPSSELPFHESVYRRRPDIHAVLHAHSPSLVAFSIVREVPDIDLVSSVRKTCGEVKMAKYAVPGSEELGENIAKEFDGGVNIVLLENHGVCIGGPDLFTAFMQLETLEYSASLQIIAGKIGNVKPLTAEAFRVTENEYNISMDDFVPRTHSTEECAVRRDMITLIHRSYRQGLFSSTQGTYSAKLSDGSFVITPSSRDRAYLEEEDLVRIKNGMKEEGKLPSRAVHLHELIYRWHPEIGAVLTAHPRHVMAFAVTDAEFDPRTIPESYLQLRGIRKENFEDIYVKTEEAAKVFSDKVPVVIYRNDSVVATGKDLLQAFDRLEVAEATAHSIIASHDLGPIKHITPKEIDELKAAFNITD